jgi:hypothetical protein
MKRGTLSPPYRGTLRQANGSPIDLSTADHVNFVMRQRRTLTPVVEARAAVLQEGDAVTGTNVGLVQYAWVAGDTDGTGDYYGEFAIYDADGNITARVPSDGYQEIRILGNLSAAPNGGPPTGPWDGGMATTTFNIRLDGGAAPSTYTTTIDGGPA